MTEHSLARSRDPEMPPAPDMSKLETENDEPVDNFFSEREQKLLSESLEA